MQIYTFIIKILYFYFPSDFTRRVLAKHIIMYANKVHHNFNNHNIQYFFY